MSSLLKNCTPLIAKGDMFKPESEGDTEPAWVTQEREQFGLYRDRDGDGKMNAQEIGEWILPTEYDHAEAEAKHLMYEADVNKVSVSVLHYLSVAAMN